MNRQRKWLRLVSMCILAAMSLSMASGALADFQARINSSSAKVYASPSTGSKGVSGGKGITVTVTKYSGSWAQIRYKGYTGYTQVKNLNLVKRIKAYTGKSTPVYRQASSSSSRMGTLPIGTGVYVVGKSGGYYRVQNASASVTGYVAAGNLTTYAKLSKAYQAYKEARKNSGGGSSGSSASESTAGMSRIDKVLKLAQSLVGRKYAIDDNPPASFNCSSFVKYCMGKYGYSFEGTAAEQAKMRNKVAKDDIRKGDVLCFDTDSNGVCDHTAIYMGSNQFVEASQGAGKVQINTLDDWYRGKLMHAIRPK